MTFRRLSVLLLLMLLIVSTVPLVAQDTECEEGFRFFDDELLGHDPLCIPESPERIVTLNPQSFDLLTAAGIEPIGAVGYIESIYARNFSYMIEDTEITYVGFPTNIELVLELEPDLIIGSAFADLENYDQLNAIAPTVIPEALPNVQWETSMQFLGEALNLTDEVDALLAEYDARVATLQELLGDPSEIEVSVIRYRLRDAQANIDIQLANAFSTDILADVGFARPEIQSLPVEEAEAQFGSPVAANISLEELQLIDGQYLFAWAQGASAELDADNAEAWGILSDNPLWGTLEAVQNEQAFQVGGQWVGWGFAAAHEVLDDLFVYVADVDPQEVSPNPFLTEDIEDDTNMEATEEANTTESSEIAQGVNELAFPLTVTDFEGREVVLNEAPERILIANRAYTLGPMLALGVAPVQLHTFPWDFVEEGEVLPWEENALAAIEADPERFINTNDQYSLEVFASANPDVIFIDGRITTAVDGLIDQLEAIAPTIQTAGARDWRANILTIADVIGQSEAGEQLVAQVEGKIDAVAEQADTLGAVGNTFAVVSFQPDQVFVCTDQEYGPTNLMLSIGLEMTPEVAELGPNVCTPLSLETVDLLNNTDYLLIFQFGGLTVDEAREQPLVDSIPALQEGRFDFIPDSALGIAFDDINPLSIDVLLPTLESAVEKAAQVE
ncbi:MAG: ABC transporter substrate-binding protein [Chloroflexota bacterium]